MGCSGSAIADRENFSTFVPRIRSLHIVICQRCIGTLKSGKFFASSNTVRSRKGARCFVGFTGLPEPQELQIQRHSSSLAQMSPFVRTPADAIESYAAAGCFPIIGFFIQKRVASLFSCRRSFLLSPSATYSAHPADRAAPPHNKKTAAEQTGRPSHRPTYLLSAAITPLGSHNKKQRPEGRRISLTPGAVSRHKTYSLII